MKFVKSDSADYAGAVSSIEKAIRSGELRSEDTRQNATQFVDPHGWRSSIEGLDWIELELYATENKMPFKSVADLLAVLKSLK